MLSAQQQFRTALRGALLNAYKLSRDQGRKEIVIQGKSKPTLCLHATKRDSASAMIVIRVYQSRSL